MKQRIAEILKSLGLTTVRMDQTDSGRFIPRKIFKNLDGKAVKAIEGSSQGPMTMTDAHIRRNEELERKVFDALRPISKSIRHEHRLIEAKIDIGGGKVRTLFFSWELFPTFTRNVNLDPMYQTWWFTVSSKDSKEQ